MRILFFTIFFWGIATVWSQENKLGIQLQNESELLLYINNAVPINETNNRGIKIMQQGEFNTASVYGGNVMLRQNGSYQQTYITESSLIPSGMQINVEGKNSYVEVVGSNSVLHNATLTIKGDNRRVIIRNYR